MWVLKLSRPGVIIQGSISQLMHSSFPQVCHETRMLTGLLVICWNGLCLRSFEPSFMGRKMVYVRDISVLKRSASPCLIFTCGVGH